MGFVVGATHSEEAKKIRERYKNIFFLLPGYGAQGAKAEDIRTYLNDFNGGVVNSSRGIIKYYQKFEDGEERFAHYTREDHDQVQSQLFALYSKVIEVRSLSQIIGEALLYLPILMELLMMLRF